MSRTLYTKETPPAAEPGALPGSKLPILSGGGSPRVGGRPVHVCLLQGTKLGSLDVVTMTLPDRRNRGLVASEKLSQLLRRSIELLGQFLGGEFSSHFYSLRFAPYLL